MTNKAQHTPTPWHNFDMDEKTGSIAIGASCPHESTIIASIKPVHTRMAISAKAETEANAAFIVKAVNHFDKMVEALKGIQDAQRSGTYAEAFKAVDEVLKDVQ